MAAQSQLGATCIGLREGVKRTELTHGPYPISTTRLRPWLVAWHRSRLVYRKHNPILHFGCPRATLALAGGSLELVGLGKCVSHHG